MTRGLARSGEESSLSSTGGAGGTWRARKGRRGSKRKWEGMGGEWGAGGEGRNIKVEQEISCPGSERMATR